MRCGCQQGAPHGVVTLFWLSMHDRSIPSHYVIRTGGGDGSLHQSFGNPPALLLLRGVAVGKIAGKQVHNRLYRCFRVVATRFDYHARALLGTQSE
ncbi:hypothetical protein Pan181_04210 [Aeoliella mucimassa]|uniref:Uncharacterized protein n=1 Tax=Aeoliella mucimassa TaxID=2527972 RepID=A0A518AHM7_9BACT|nr:hypothetical protein Pan181_04210 [Aeoliella mucimassa]